MFTDFIVYIYALVKYLVACLQPFVAMFINIKR